MLHHLVISQEMINTESLSTFQFLWIRLVEFRYSFVFYKYVGKTHIVFSGINQQILAAVTEQTTEDFDWKLIGFI